MVEQPRMVVHLTLWKVKTSKMHVALRCDLKHDCGRDENKSTDTLSQTFSGGANLCRRLRVRISRNSVTAIPAFVVVLFKRTHNIAD